MSKTIISGHAALLLVLAGSIAAQAQEGDAEMPGLLDQTVPVADEPLEPEARTDELSQEVLLAEFARFKRLLAERAFDEADSSAKRVVEMAIRLHGPQSRETARALHNLALVQYNNEQHEAAIQNFTSTIEILETLEDRLHSDLVNPLRGLGAAQLGAGRPDLAVATFDRATHITHVNEGPHNIEQVEILESLAESNLRMGDADATRDVLERINLLNTRHFEGNPLGIVPSLMRRAQWQHRAQYYTDERVTYRRIIRIIETSLSKDAVELVEPLRRLGESFYYFNPMGDTSNIQPVSMSGESYLRRAVRIAEGAEDYPWQDLAGVRLALADHYNFIGSPSRSRKAYIEIWESLSDGADQLQARRELLEQPILLRLGPLPRFIDGRANNSPVTDEFLVGTVTVEYTVAPNGRVRNIRSQVTPPEFSDMQRTVHREMRQRVFRPKLVEGEPVMSDILSFEHQFYYRQADLDALQDESES